MQWYERHNNHISRQQRMNDLTPPFARAMAIIAAASMTQDNGFHMNPKNLRILLCCENKYRDSIHKHMQQITSSMKFQTSWNCETPYNLRYAYPWWIFSQLRAISTPVQDSRPEVLDRPGTQLGQGPSWVCIPSKTLSYINDTSLEVKRTDFSSSLLGPTILIRCSPSASVKPCLEHLNCWKTSSMGTCSCIYQLQFSIATNERAISLAKVIATEVMTFNGIGRLPTQRIQNGLSDVPPKTTMSPWNLCKHNSIGLVRTHNQTKSLIGKTEHFCLIDHLPHNFSSSLRQMRRRFHCKRTVQEYFYPTSQADSRPDRPQTESNNFRTGAEEIFTQRKRLPHNFILSTLYELSTHRFKTQQFKLHFKYLRKLTDTGIFVLGTARVTSYQQIDIMSRRNNY